MEVIFEESIYPTDCGQCGWDEIILFISVEFLSKSMYFTPKSMHGASFNAFSGFGVVSLILFAVVCRRGLEWVR